MPLLKVTGSSEAPARLTGPFPGAAGAAHSAQALLSTDTTLGSFSPVCKSHQRSFVGLFPQPKRSAAQSAAVELPPSC